MPHFTWTRTAPTPVSFFLLAHNRSHPGVKCGSSNCGHFCFSPAMAYHTKITISACLKQPENALAVPLESPAGGRPDFSLAAAEKIPDFYKNAGVVDHGSKYRVSWLKKPGASGHRLRVSQSRFSGAPTMFVTATLAFYLGWVWLISKKAESRFSSRPCFCIKNEKYCSMAPAAGLEPATRWLTATCSAD